MITKKNLIENLNVNDLLDKIRAKHSDKEDYRFLYTDNVEEVNNVTYPVKIVPIVTGYKAKPMPDKPVEVNGKYHFIDVLDPNLVYDFAEKNNFHVEFFQKEFSIGLAVIDTSRAFDPFSDKFFDFYIIENPKKDKVQIPEIIEVKKDESQVFESKPIEFKTKVEDIIFIGQEDNRKDKNDNNWEDNNQLS